MLVDGDRYELILRLSRLERIVDLLADEPLTVFGCADSQRLHDVPARVVGAADIADFAMAHQRIERLQRLFERCLAIPFMHLIEVDHVRA